ncbi:MAG: hypothetical protein LBE62_03025 [Azonexus sp.]|nr:hypothetical protein [Azonexus sp.]
MIGTLLAASVITGCGQSDNESGGAGNGGDRTLSFRTPPGLSDADMPKITAASVALVKSCPGVVKYWDDLAQQGFTSSTHADSDDAEQMGWDKVVAIEMAVSDKPKSIPVEWNARGEHCFFRIGTEYPPGVSITKTPCIAVCLDKAVPAKTNNTVIPVESDDAEPTDADAKKQAMRMERTLAQAKDDFMAVIKSGNRDVYWPTIEDPVRLALKFWREDNLRYRALFPYSRCRHAATALLSYRGAWSRNDPDKSWLNDAAKTFQKEYKACQQAIAKPDLSLKNIQ